MPYGNIFKKKKKTNFRALLYRCMSLYEQESVLKKSTQFQERPLLALPH